MNYHDPIRQENYLRQCLSHDKKPIGVLLGAGAPMALANPITGCCPLIPDITNLTKLVCEKLSSNTEFKNIFHCICSHFNDMHIKNPNIEAMLSYIRSLDLIVGSGEVNGLNSIDLRKTDKYMCNIVNDIVNKNLTSNNTPYHRVAAWISAISRAYPVEIFTTNYDLLMEQALEDIRVSYFDGFSGSRYTFFDTTSIEDDKLPERWARLWKLHGSINWFINKDNRLYRSYVSYDHDDIKIIHPSHLKYEESRKMPYLAMIDRLKSFFKKPSALLLICGYSFGDMHINDTIIQGLQSNSNSIAFGMMYGNISNHTPAISLAKSCPNLSILAEDEAIIGMQQIPWVQRSTEDGLSENTIAIDWKADPTTKIAKAQFKLGDFHRMGEFFGDIVGSQNKGES